MRTWPTRSTSLWRRWALLALLGLAGVAWGPVAAQAQSANPSFKIESGQLVLPGPVAFATASDKLQPDSDAVLAYVKAFLDAKPAISLLRIENHTDDSGSPATNQTLSVNRAAAVGRRLISLGVDCNRLIAVGFGGTKSIADNRTPEGKAQNRRTVFAMAALLKRAIGGMPLDGGGQAAPSLCAK